MLARGSVMPVSFVLAVKPLASKIRHSDVILLDYQLEKGTKDRNVCR